MTHEFRNPPPGEAEARLTALLLGELSGADAALLRRELENDQDLARLYERLKDTVGLVREAVTTQAGEVEPQPKLSEERRQALLQHFKTVSPEPFAAPTRNRFSWLIPVGIAAVLMLMAAGMFFVLPASRTARYAALANGKGMELSSLSTRSPHSAERRAQSGSAIPEPPVAAPPVLTRSAAGPPIEQAKVTEPPAQRSTTATSSGGIGGGIGGGAGGSLAIGGIGVVGGRLEVPQKDANQVLRELFNKNDSRGNLASSRVEGTGRREENAGGRLSGQRGPLAALPDQTGPTLGDQPLLGTFFERVRPNQTRQQTKEEPESSATAQPSAPPFSSASGRTGFLADRIESGIAARGTAKNPKPALSAQPPGAPPSGPTGGPGGDHRLRFLKRYGLLAPNSNQPRVVMNGFPSRPATAPEAAFRFGAAYGGGVFPGSPASLPVTNQFAQSAATSSFYPPGGANGLAVAGQTAESAVQAGGALYARDNVGRPAERFPAQTDKPLRNRQSAPAASAWQPEVQTRDNPFSTFSMNVSDVSLQLAAASLANGQMPDPATIRSEEFLNAFDYRDPEPGPGIPIGFTWERARDPFEQNRDLLRFSIQTAAQGRAAGRPLNLVLLLDNSGSMQRADRVQILHAALRVLASELRAQDRLSVVLFARTAYLWVDAVSGDQAGRVAKDAAKLTPQGGTNLEEALRLAYETALRHYLANGINRVVLLTDGAANLGNVDPSVLGKSVEAHRKQGVALDCFGVGWEGYNDYLLEELSRDGNGRYGFINTPEEAAADFATKLAGALKVAALDLKVQVEFNPARVTAYRQIGYRKHQLTKQQFRDNTVAAAEIGAAESGNALYVLAVNPQGQGDLGTVRIRYRLPGTTDYREHAWDVPYTGNAVSLGEASPAMRLAATAGAFAEWLESSPYAAEVTPDRLLAYLNGIPEMWGADDRPRKLETMIREAERLAEHVQR
jgi:Mg-chelatase subunit ChlD